MQIQRLLRLRLFHKNRFQVSPSVGLFIMGSDRYERKNISILGFTYGPLKYDHCMLKRVDHQT